MTTFDDLWYLTVEADQRAEQAYHRLRERYDPLLEFEREKRVSRSRFRTLLERIGRSGAPYGAHTVVYRQTGELLLVRHEGVDMWVVPGGEVRPDETFREAAERELAEEAGVEASYEGLALLTRVSIDCGEHEGWGVLPVFAARAGTVEPASTTPTARPRRRAGSPTSRRTPAIVTSYWRGAIARYDSDPGSGPNVSPSRSSARIRLSAAWAWPAS